MYWELLRIDVKNIKDLQMEGFFSEDKNKLGILVTPKWTINSIYKCQVDKLDSWSIFGQ